MMAEAHENESLRKMLSVKEVASILGVHSGTIRRWEKEGLLLCHRIGPRGSLRFKQEDILDFLNNSKSEVRRADE
jgi:excisionase family DNA binding protein